MAFTVYTAVETPLIELEMPLYDNAINISNWASGTTSKGNIIAKPKMIVSNEEYIPQIYNNDISFEELVKLENLPIRITSGYRHGARTKQGKPSNHGKKDSKGNSMAYDIVPINGDFEGLLNTIYSNPRVVSWLRSRNFGILEETNPSINRITGATGNHLHIGPDNSAIEMTNKRLSKAQQGMKIPYTEYTAIEEPKVTLNLPLFEEPILLDWSSGFTKEGIPLAKPKMIVTKDTAPKNTTSSVVQEQLKTSSNNYAVLFFMNKGLDKHHSVGIVANLMLESKLNPNAINKLSGAYGIALWLGDRKKKLFNTYGKNPTLDLQLEYVWEELNSNEKNALNNLLQTSSYDEAVRSIMNHYERPSNKEKADSISIRLNYGKQLYEI